MKVNEFEEYVDEHKNYSEFTSDHGVIKYIVENKQLSSKYPIFKVDDTAMDILNKIEISLNIDENIYFKSNIISRYTKDEKLLNSEIVDNGTKSYLNIALLKSIYFKLKDNTSGIYNIVNKLRVDFKKSKGNSKLISNSETGKFLIWELLIHYLQVFAESDEFDKLKEIKYITKENGKYIFDSQQNIFVYLITLISDEAEIKNYIKNHYINSKGKFSARIFFEEILKYFSQIGKFLIEYSDKNVEDYQSTSYYKRCENMSKEFYRYRYDYQSYKENKDKEKFKNPPPSELSNPNVKSNYKIIEKFDNYNNNTELMEAKAQLKDILVENNIIP